VSLKDKIVEKRQQITDLQLEISLLLETCDHEEVMDRERYHEGDYYNKSYTEKWTECLVCGKKMGDPKIQTYWYS
jgi:hypothetical protein